MILGEMLATLLIGSVVSIFVICHARRYPSVTAAEIMDRLATGDRQARDALISALDHAPSLNRGAFLDDQLSTARSSGKVIGFLIASKRLLEGTASEPWNAILWRETYLNRRPILAVIPKEYDRPEVTAAYAAVDAILTAHDLAERQDVLTLAKAAP